MPRKSSPGRRLRERRVWTGTAAINDDTGQRVVMITLYNSATSPNGQKIRILMEEAAIPYREIRLRHETARYRRMS